MGPGADEGIVYVCGFASVKHKQQEQTWPPQGCSPVSQLLNLRALSIAYL